MNLLWGLSVPLRNIVKQDLGGSFQMLSRKGSWGILFIDGAYWCIWRPDMSALPHFMTASYKMVCCKPDIFTHFRILNFLSLSLLEKCLIFNNKKWPTYRNWISLLMFLSWEAFVRKIIICSTDMCKEFCWVWRDEGWLLPSENSHAGQREVRSVEKV